MRAAEAVSHGAVTIVNAMAIGKGAALGIDLWTKAKVTIIKKPGRVICQNLSDPTEDHRLMQVTVNRIFRYFKLHGKYGAIIQTQSNIPIAVGLKSSSAASNAIVLATLKAIGKQLDDYEIVRLGVDASLEAHVTLTGAFDDACASYFGGVMATNNKTRQVLRHLKPEKDLSAMIYVPNAKKYTKDVDASKFYKIKPLIELAFQETLKGNFWLALTLNGLTYAEFFGYDTAPIRDAINSGAVAAGLTGKGPAIVAIAHKSNLRKVHSTWSSLPGRIIKASFNYEKARSANITQ